MNELLGNRHDNIHLYSEAQEVDFGGKQILMMPWINTQNEIYSFGMMDESKSDTMMGHFEIAGLKLCIYCKQFSIPSDIISCL